MFTFSHPRARGCSFWNLGSWAERKVNDWGCVQEVAVGYRCRDNIGLRLRRIRKDDKGHQEMRQLPSGRAPQVRGGQEELACFDASIVCARIASG